MTRVVRVTWGAGVSWGKCVTSGARIAPLAVMSDGGTKNVFTLVNIDTKALGETARALLDRVSEAIGGIARPWQIRRVADADSDAKLIGAMADVRVTSLQKRAAQRWLAEEEQRQANMEAITAAALPQVKPDAQPDKIERDWLVNFFDKSRLTSDGDMQQLWARILAGEANAPGKFRKRTVNLMASLDKFDAELFQKLCRFRWSAPVDHRPIIFDHFNAIYNEYGINFDTLLHLDAIGLTTFEPAGGYVLKNLSETAPFTQFICTYFDHRFAAVLPKGSNQLSLGSVMLSRAGIEICDICTAEPIPNYSEYVVDCWRKEGVNVIEIPSGAGAS